MKTSLALIALRGRISSFSFKAKEILIRYHKEFKLNTLNSVIGDACGTCFIKIILQRFAFNFAAQN
jgi:hypothetical protein